MNRYWRFRKFGNDIFQAAATRENKLCYPEKRVYYALDAFERDFGKVDFDDIEVDE